MLFGITRSVHPPPTPPKSYQMIDMVLPCSRLIALHWHKYLINSPSKNLGITIQWVKIYSQTWDVVCQFIKGNINKKNVYCICTSYSTKKVSFVRIIQIFRISCIWNSTTCYNIRWTDLNYELSYLSQQHWLRVGRRVTRRLTRSQCCWPCYPKMHSVKRSQNNINGFWKTSKIDIFQFVNTHIHNTYRVFRWKLKYL